MEFTPFFQVVERNDDSYVYERPDNCALDTFTNFFDLRKNCQLCDIVLLSGGKRVSAHKVVLAASIPYFQMMFTSDMVESKSEEIELEMIEPEALVQMVNYAYNRPVKISLQNVQAIMTASNYLQVTKLTEACSKFLLKHLRPENVLNILNFCRDMNSDIDVISSIESYAKKYFIAVSRGDEFLNLNIEEVFELLSSDDLYVDDEMEIFFAVLRWLKSGTDRTSEASRLLSCVRLPLLTPEQLADVVSTNEIIRSDHKCRDLVDEAKNYHLLPERRSSLKSFKCTSRHCEGIPGIIFAIGGLMKASSARSTMEVYDPLTASWSASSNMLTMRTRVGVATLKRKVYAVGGFNGHERLQTVEMFDYDTNQWTSQTPMMKKRSAMAAIFHEGLMYVCGGYDGNTSLDSVEIFDPQTSTWSTGVPMIKHRSAAGVAVLDDYIYVIGGHDGTSIFSSVERFSIKEQKWEAVASMSTKRCRLGSAVYGGMIYACGGYDGLNFLRSVERFNPVSMEWEPVTPMTMKRSRVGLVSNSDGLYAIAGFDGESNLASCERYKESTDDWEFVASLRTHEGNVGVGVIPVPPELL